MDRSDPLLTVSATGEAAVDVLLPAIAQDERSVIRNAASVFGGHFVSGSCLRSLQLQLQHEREGVRRAVQRRHGEYLSSLGN